MPETFGASNVDWIAALQEQRGYLAGRGVLPAVREFALGYRARKWLLLAYPLTVDRAAFGELAAAASAFLAAQTTLLRHLCARTGRAELLARFEIPAALGPYVDWAELCAGERVIARFDLVPAADGYYFCELNADSSVSGYETWDCVARYAETLGWPLLRGQRPPQADIADLIGRIAAARGLDRVAICDWSTRREVGYFGFDLLTEYVQRRLPGLDVRLVYSDGYPAGWLDPAVGRHTLAYRGFMFTDMDDGGAFLARLAASGATIVNTVESEIRTHKSWFALLGEPRYRRLVDPATLAALDRFVPATSALTADGLDAALADRDRHVFKLGTGCGGAGVLMGAEHSPEELRARLAEVGPDRWTVQRRVPGERLPLARDDTFAQSPHHLVLGLYLVGGKPSGLLVRASDSSPVVNVASAAATTWAVPLTPAERATHLAAIRSFAAAGSG